LVLATFSICLTTLNYSRFYAISLLLSLILTVSALVLNNYLVPLWGMDGAAISNVVSYGLYYLLIIATVVPLCRVHVVDRRWWLILLLLLAIFALNWAWQTYLPALNIWADSILRSLVLLGGGALIAYKAGLSPEVTEQIKHLIKH
jgi:O-antigen/teichoic acid export membrane protein